MRSQSCLHKFCRRKGFSLSDIDMSVGVQHSVLHFTAHLQQTLAGYLIGEHTPLGNEGASKCHHVLTSIVIDD